MDGVGGETDSAERRAGGHVSAIADVAVDASRSWPRMIVKSAGVTLTYLPRWFVVNLTMLGYAIATM